MAKSSYHTYNIQKWVNLSTFGKILALRYKSCLMDADVPEEGGRLNADNCGQGGGGSKIGKILRTSFMDGPLCILLYLNPYYSSCLTP